jgi:hypothetical protein
VEFVVLRDSLFFFQRPPPHHQVRPARLGRNWEGLIQKFATQHPPKTSVQILLHKKRQKTHKSIFFSAKKNCKVADRQETAHVAALRLVILASMQTCRPKKFAVPL